MCLVNVEKFLKPLLILLLIGTLCCQNNVVLSDTADKNSSAYIIYCTDRRSLANAVAQEPLLKWSDIRAACNKEISAAKARDPIGFSWMANAGNGFTGAPLVLLKIFPDLAPEIWGDESSFFTRFFFLGFFTRAFFGEHGFALRLDLFRRFLAWGRSVPCRFG